MSRKNNLQLRRVHHVSMLREEAAREALAKKRKQRRIAKKEKAAADRELAGALVSLLVLGSFLE